VQGLILFGRSISESPEKHLNTYVILLRVKLQKQHIRFRVPVSVEERVSLALWRQEEEVAVYILDWESQWRNLFVVNSNKQF